MSLNEADTRAQLIDPKLHGAGWSDSSISREYPISVGRIEIIGETYRRAAPKKADYVLRLGTFTITTAKATKIPLPSIAEQKKIVAYLDKLSKKVQSLRQAQSETAADLTALRQSILVKSMSEKV